MKIPATKQITQKTLFFAVTAILILSAIAQVSAQGNPAAIDIKEFSLTPSTIDTTSSSATLTVTIRVTDQTITESGAISIQMHFRSSIRYSQSVSVNLNFRDRISGDARDGVYSKAVVFPQYSAAGTWRVEYIHISDGRNSRVVNTVQLAALGFANSLQVISNNQDIIAPEISEFSFTPSAIDTTKGSQDVTITFRATDATSGVRDIYVSFHLPDDDGFGGYNVRITSTNRISGDAKDGVYKAVLTIPQNAPLGIYGAYVYAYDAINNRNELGPAELAARGYPSQLRITDGKTTPFDFDGDGKADVSVFRPSSGEWRLNQSTNGLSATQFGLSTDKITPADFDGDGRTDVAVFRDGTWYWLNSSDGSFQAAQFGQAGDIPVPFDYTGDGRAELAVYRVGTWYTLNLANNQFNAVQFGIVTDKPVVGDYDGDGRADYAVYRDDTWYLLQSTQGFGAIQFGISTDKLVPADYDGDGKTDVAVFREGVWYLLGSQAGFTAFPFGFASDIPAPADYDGDGKSDAAVYRNGVWYLLQSTNGFAAQQFGLTNDKPIPTAYLP